VSNQPWPRRPVLFVRGCGHFSASSAFVGT
jgi:hypothetical protein